MAKDDYGKREKPRSCGYYRRKPMGKYKDELNEV